jgi:uncharacterized protein
MRVVLLGATGRIGRAITAELIGRGHDVIGVSRGGHHPDGEPIIAADASDAADVARVVEGADVVITAIGPRRGGSDAPSSLVTTAHAIVAGMQQAKLRRLIVVGGAGSLKSGNSRHIDAPVFPEAHRPLALAHIDARDIYFTANDLDWIYVSPAALIEPGERTGVFRVGGDELLVASDGTSRITISDYAIGIADQVEHPTVTQQQITLAY